MEYRKPPIKEKDLKIQESFNKQFLDFFPDKPIGVPKMAWETCDNHLTLKQPFRFVDPKGNPVNEVYWEEPIDVAEFWRDKMRLIWFLIFVSASFFFIIIYYFWGSIYA